MMKSSLSVIVGALLLLPSLLVGVVDAQGCGTSRRRPWRSLSCAEQQAYMDAVQLMKNSGVYDEITRVHQASGDDVHFVPPFLPFHRWVIWVFEREMQRLTGTCITVPYWDWERGSRDQTAATVLSTWGFGTNNGGGCTSDGITRGWRVAENGGCLIRRFVDRIGFTRDVEVLNRITNMRDFRQFWPSYEAAPHTSVHDWVGGPMEGFWAPDDPLFHLHHANVDRHYALWQNYWGQDEVAIGQLGGPHYAGNLDAPMRIQQGPRIDFNYPGLNRPPTIREVMHIRGGIIDVQYVDCNLAQILVNTDPNYQNNPAWLAPGNAATQGCGGGGGNGGGGGGGQPPAQCRRVGQTCTQHSNCCSGRCRRSTGLCRRRFPGERRNRRAIGFEAPPFSNPDLVQRWTELMIEFPDSPNLVFEALGREDCEKRAIAAAHNNSTTIDGPSPMDVVLRHANATQLWVDQHVNVTGNLTAMYECHYFIPQQL